jgi:hypothetical protein
MARSCHCIYTEIVSILLRRAVSWPWSPPQAYPVSYFTSRFEDGAIQPTVHSWLPGSSFTPTLVYIMPPEVALLVDDHTRPRQSCLVIAGTPLPYHHTTTYGAGLSFQSSGTFLILFVDTLTYSRAQRPIIAHLHQGWICDRLSTFSTQPRYRTSDMSGSRDPPKKSALVSSRENDLEVPNNHAESDTKQQEESSQAQGKRVRFTGIDDGVVGKSATNDSENSEHGPEPDAGGRRRRRRKRSSKHRHGEDSEGESSRSRASHHPETQKPRGGSRTSSGRHSSGREGGSKTRSREPNKGASAGEESLSGDQGLRSSCSRKGGPSRPHSSRSGQASERGTGGSGGAARTGQAGSSSSSSSSSKRRSKDCDLL